MPKVRFTMMQNMADRLHNSYPRKEFENRPRPGISDKRTTGSFNQRSFVDGE
jgi:hypothetical protein